MTVHRHSAKRAGWTAALMCLMASTPLWAQPQGCRDFAWDVHQERTLFAGQPNHVQGGTSAESSPRVETDHLYQVALVPQSQVRYVTPPGKARSADGAYGGMVRFRVPRTGSYRVALDAAFWVDVVADGKLLESEDFSGQHGCANPRKIVVFRMSAGRDLWLQISNARSALAQITLTESPSRQAPAGH